MISQPIKVKQHVFRRNALPAVVWMLILAAFAFGYFVGGFTQAVAYKNALDKEQHYTGGK